MELNNQHGIIRVLLVDDDEEDYFIINRLFRSMKSVNTHVEWISSSDEAIERIKQAQHDAYFIDYRIDARTGLDILQEVNALERVEPFILMTGVGDQAIEKESLKLAASDYLVKKNLTSDSLARALYYALGRKEQERQRINHLIELNKTKDEFISIASHQLRTPATTVKQYVAMVLDGLSGEVSDRQRLFLMKAYESNERQLSIINDLLRVAQIDAGTFKLVPETINVSQLVVEAVEDFLPSFIRSDQQLAGDIEPDIHAEIDKNAIRMVIDNLLENARKYSESGARTTIVLSDESDAIKIAVKDEGIGVNNPDRLFKKFSRIENKLSTEVGGTGIGLYWAQSITELHGGTLDYRPNTPKGSIFTLILPNVK